MIFYAYESPQKNGVNKSETEYENKVNDRAFLLLIITDAPALIATGLR